MTTTTGAATTTATEATEATEELVAGRFRDSIGGQITLSSITLALVPLAIIAALTIVGLLTLGSRTDDGLGRSQSELATDTIGASRAEQAALVVDRMDTYIDERANDVIDWSRNETVVAAAEATYSRAAAVSGLTVEQIEERFDGDDQLDTTGTSRRFLTEQIVDRPAFAEVFFTDADGLNIGTSNPTSDFVQRDEDWWQNAWENGAFISPLEFDESAGVFSFEVSIRIDNSTGSPLGVMKAVVDASTVQAFADEFADETTGIDVSIVTSDGRLLAETETEHAPNRIGSVAGFGPQELAAFDTALTAAEQGEDRTFVLLDESVVGYGLSTSSRTLDRLGVEVPVDPLITIVEQPSERALAPLDSIESLQDDLGVLTTGLIVTTLALLALAIGAAIVGSRFIASRIAGPINELQIEAHRVANDELPQVVSTLRQHGPKAELPDVSPIDIDTRGEVAELAAAFNSVRSTALHLAAGEAIGRSKDVAGILLSLGRRNQQLVGRQLMFIDQLERNEGDPEALANLFQLDQMATRMRRNAESLLVLAGEEPIRRGTTPVPVDDVIRAAVSAVEDFDRVELTIPDTVQVRPMAANDLSHLLAELIENAASFSPPASPVEVYGTASLDGSYTISIVDHGIGMSRDQLAESNRTLNDPNLGDEASTSQLGLLVVGRLAARHGIDARLIESATTGITAKVTIPPALVVGAPTPRLEPNGAEEPAFESVAASELRHRVDPTADDEPVPATAGTLMASISSLTDDRPPSTIPADWKPPATGLQTVPGPSEPVPAPPPAPRPQRSTAVTGAVATNGPGPEPVAPPADSSIDPGPRELPVPPVTARSTTLPPTGDASPGPTDHGDEPVTRSQPPVAGPGATTAPAGPDDPTNQAGQVQVRRRVRRTPPSVLTEDAAVTERPEGGTRPASAARAEDVRNTLDRFQRGVDAGRITHPTGSVPGTTDPTDLPPAASGDQAPADGPWTQRSPRRPPADSAAPPPDDRPPTRAEEVRDGLHAFTSGVARGRRSSLPPRVEPPPDGAGHPDDHEPGPDGSDTDRSNTP